MHTMDLDNQPENRVIASMHIVHVCVCTTSAARWWTHHSYDIIKQTTLKTDNNMYYVYIATVSFDVCAMLLQSYT